MMDRLTIIQSVVLALLLLCFIAATYALDKRGEMSGKAVVSFERKKHVRDGEQDAAYGAGLSNITINIVAASGAGLAGWLTWYLVMPS